MFVERRRKKNEVDHGESLQVAKAKRMKKAFDPFVGHCLYISAVVHTIHRYDDVRRSTRTYEKDDQEPKHHFFLFTVSDEEVVQITARTKDSGRFPLSWIHNLFERGTIAVACHHTLSC